MVNFWYGLKAMNCLTQTGQWELRIDFEFPNKTKSYLHYNVFRVGSASEEYPLTISEFTTQDNDNDKMATTVQYNPIIIVVTEMEDGGTINAGA